MLVKPGLDQLMDQVDSKYTLVIVSSKRARHIMEEQDMLLENPVSLALHEIAAHSLSWTREDDDRDVEK